MIKRRQAVVALAGNPNTGKSTVFNALTGLQQHTGNWPGKTVLKATGTYTWSGTSFTIVDLPGTYSLIANSPDEEVARDFILFGAPAVTVVVVDACSLERNLNLVLQVLELTPQVILCLNLMDEARRRKIKVDIPRLETELGIPTIPCVARTGEGLSTLKDTILELASGRIKTAPKPIKYSAQIEARLEIIACQLAMLSPQFSPRWLALRLLERDEKLWQQLIRKRNKLVAQKTTAPSFSIKKVVTWLS